MSTMTMTDLPPIFAECVADDDYGKHKLTVPFIKAGRAYATNGQICVRMPMAGDDTDGAPSANDLSWDGCSRYSFNSASLLA